MTQTTDDREGKVRRAAEHVLGMLKTNPDWLNGGWIRAYTKPRVSHDVMLAALDRLVAEGTIEPSYPWPAGDVRRLDDDYRLVIPSGSEPT